MRSIGLFAASLLACAGAPVSAQTFGPPITGLCLLSRTHAIAASRAGQSMNAQLRGMQAALSGELARQRQALDEQRRQLEARRNTVAPVQYQQQLTALNQQTEALDRQQNARFITAQTRAQQQIDGALNDALGRVVTRRACSVVMERDNAYGWNNAMDITAEVTREMDGIAQAVAVQ